MPLTFTVPAEFLEYRAEKAKLYNRRGRNENKFLMDLDCEFHEWTMIKEGLWEPSDDWRIDAYTLGKAIDVKFISKWYNISPLKMCNILQQRFILDGYLFFEWITRPGTPLQEGDEISYRQVRYVDYETLLDNVRVSKYNGHYVDVRGIKE